MPLRASQPQHSMFRRVPVRWQVRPFAGDRYELLVVAVQFFHADLPWALGCRCPAKQDHGPVRRVAGVVLKVGAEGQLFPVAAVHTDDVDVALDRLAKNSLAVLRPLRRTASFAGLEPLVFPAVQTEDEDVDVPQVPAGDGEVLAVRSEGRYSAALPLHRGDQSFLAGGEVPDEGLVVLDQEDRL